MRHAIRLGQPRRAERALDHGAHGDVTRITRFGEPMVVIHHLGQQGLIERTPVHADPNRLAVLQRNLDDRAEVLVVRACRPRYRD